MTPANAVELNAMAMIFLPGCPGGQPCKGDQITGWANRKPPPQVTAAYPPEAG